MRPFRPIRKMLMIAVAALVLAPIFAADQIAWIKDYDTALKQAAKEQKFIVLDISASW